MRNDTKKLYIRLPEARLEQVMAMADEIGINYTNFGGMLLWMGFCAYMRQVAPEKLLSEEQLYKIGKMYAEDKDNQNAEPTN